MITGKQLAILIIILCAVFAGLLLALPPIYSGSPLIKYGPPIGMIVVGILYRLFGPRRRETAPVVVIPDPVFAFTLVLGAALAAGVIGYIAFTKDAEGRAIAIIGSLAFGGAALLGVAFNWILRRLL